jgi:hypothetical protein
MGQQRKTTRTISKGYGGTKRVSMRAGERRFAELEFGLVEGEDRDLRIGVQVSEKSSRT